MLADARPRGADGAVGRCAGRRPAGAGRGMPTGGTGPTSRWANGRTAKPVGRRAIAPCARHDDDDDGSWCGPRSAPSPIAGSRASCPGRLPRDRPVLVAPASCWPLPQPACAAGRHAAPVPSSPFLHPPFQLRLTRLPTATRASPRATHGGCAARPPGRRRLAAAGARRAGLVGTARVQGLPARRPRAARALPRRLVAAGTQHLRGLCHQPYPLPAPAPAPRPLAAGPSPGCRCRP